MYISKIKNKKKSPKKRELKRPSPVRGNWVGRAEAIGPNEAHKTRTHVCCCSLRTRTCETQHWVGDSEEEKQRTVRCDFFFLLFRDSQNLWNLKRKEKKKKKTKFRFVSLRLFSETSNGISLPLIVADFCEFTVTNR